MKTTNGKYPCKNCYLQIVIHCERASGFGEKFTVMTTCNTFGKRPDGCGAQKPCASRAEARIDFTSLTRSFFTRSKSNVLRHGPYRTFSGRCSWDPISYETDRQLAGTVEADELYHTAGNKGQAKHGGKKHLGRRARGRRKKREPGRGHYEKDRPAIIAWVSRQGAVVIHATRDFTVKTVQKAADLAVHAGSRLYTDSASSYRALKGYVHAFVNHTQKEYARGDVHENRAECLFSLLKPYLRVFRGISKTNLPGYVGFFQFLRNFRQQNAFEQAEMILYAALDPSIASRARKGAFVRCLDHFDLLQTAIN
jgi:transposase